MRPAVRAAACAGLGFLGVRLDEPRNQAPTDGRRRHGARRLGRQGAGRGEPRGAGDRPAGPVSAGAALGCAAIASAQARISSQSRRSRCSGGVAFSIPRSMKLLGSSGRRPPKTVWSRASSRVAAVRTALGSAQLGSGSVPHGPELNSQSGRSPSSRRWSRVPSGLEPALHVHAAAEHDGVVIGKLVNDLGRQAVRVVTGRRQLVCDGGGDLGGGAVLAREGDEDARHRRPVPERWPPRRRAGRAAPLR